MDLERVSVQIRTRSAMEALDLGVALGRAWWWRSVLGILMAATPVFVIANTAFIGMPWIAIVVVWWAKPIFERIPLTLVSRGFFGDECTAKEALSLTRWPGAGELLSTLTVGRLSAWRSYTAPVGQLEGLEGADRRRRVSVLTRAHTGSGLLLTLVGLFAELFIYFGVFAFLSMLVPEELGWGVSPPDPWAEEILWTHVISNLILFAVQVAVMPFFSAAGFALYIQRRVELEGWDLELAFRRLTRRMSGAETTSSRRVAS